MNILLTGATGFLGVPLTRRLLSEGHTVVAWVRNLNRARRRLPETVRCVESLSMLARSQFDAIINLAGEPIADRRWTGERKVVLRNSRVGVTRELARFIDSLAQPPGVILSGSAIGYYGSQPAEFALHEDSLVKDGFTHQLCRDWEEAARQLERVNNRVCMLRTGIVLGQGGGALGKMLMPFRLGLGGPIGDGQQMMSWIHIDDWIGAVLFLLANDAVSGPVNLVSPEPVTNARFARSLGKALHRPALLRVPCSGLRLVMGEGAELLCEGQKVIPRKLQDYGYRFRYPELEGALESIVKATHAHDISQLDAL